MSKHYAFPEGSHEKLKAALHGARTIDEYRRVLCIWLRAVGLSGAQVAAALDMTTDAVHRFQARYFVEGHEAVLGGPGRGGRRREVLPYREEQKLFRRLRDEASPNRTLEFRTVRQAVEQAAGHPVSVSTVSKMLARHGWERHASVSIPWNRQLDPFMYAPPRPSGLWTPKSTEDPDSGG
jgi:transposase